MYTITLSSGKKLENLELNGNNFISASPVDSALFDGGLSEVTITDGSETRTYTDMVPLSNREEDEKKLDRPRRKKRAAERAGSHAREDAGARRGPARADRRCCMSDIVSGAKSIRMALQHFLSILSDSVQDTAYSPADYAPAWEDIA